MAGFATWTALRAALDAGQVERAHFIKPTTAPASSNVRNNFFCSLWTYAGLPAPGGNPGAPGVGTVYASDTSSLAFADHASANKYIARVVLITPGNNAATTAGNAHWLLDRLVGVNLTGLTAGSTAVNTPALTRYTTGYGLIPWLETVSQAGGTGTYNIVYTNENGVGGRVGGTVSVGNTTVVGAGLRLPLAAGDLGVQSVQSITTAGAGTGTHNLILTKPILGVPGYSKGAFSPTVEWSLRTHKYFPRIFDGASLMFSYWVDDNSLDMTHRGFVEMVYA